MPVAICARRASPQSLPLRSNVLRCCRLLTAVPTYIHIHTHTHTYTYTQTHTHTHTHTHMHTVRKQAWPFRQPLNRNDSSDEKFLRISAKGSISPLDTAPDRGRSPQPHPLIFLTHDSRRNPCHLNPPLFSHSSFPCPHSVTLWSKATTKLNSLAEPTCKSSCKKRRSPEAATESASSLRSRELIVLLLEVAEFAVVQGTG